MAGGDEEKPGQSEQQEEKMADEKPAEEEEDQESSDEEPEPGLLDKPVMIFDQKRERKKVERLSLSLQEKPKKEGLDYSKGRGLKLGDIEIVKYELDRTLSNELKPLHKLLYGREGKITMVKKNIRAFCGFPYDSDSKEYSNLQWSLEKFTNTGLQRLCEIFGMEQKGKRDELKEKVLKFLMEPYNTNKKVPGTAKTKSKKKRKSKGESSKKSTAVLSGDDDDDVESNDEDADNEEEEDKNEEEDGDEKSEDKRKVTKKKSTSKPKKSKPTVIKLPTPSKKRKADEKAKKSSTPKKSSPKKAAKKSTYDESDDDDDEPLVKRAKPEGPSDAMIEKIVRELLEEADLETVTMKMICKQVFNKFPGQDLTERKAFIKDTVKKVIS